MDRRQAIAPRAAGDAGCAPCILGAIESLAIPLVAQAIVETPGLRGRCSRSLECTKGASAWALRTRGATAKNAKSDSQATDARTRL